MTQTTARFERRWTRVDGLRMHSRFARGRAAGARPVVLVHGLGVSGRYLLPTAARLAARSDVYVPDLPGFGDSAKPPEPLGVRELADVLAAWLRVHQLERVVLVGNSMGCQVLTELAVEHPELVERLVFIGPTVDRHARSFVRQTVRLFRDGVFAPPSLVAIVVADYLRAGPVRVVRTGLGALAHRVEDRLPAVAAPVLVIRGGRDQLVSQRWAEEVATLLPRGRLVVIPRSPHPANYTAPDAVAREVERFLAEEAAF